MKLFKKGIAALLAVFTALVVATPAFAADGYTISTKTGDTHTYSVYQVLTGDLANGVLSNVKAGQNYKSDVTADKAAEALAASKNTGQALANEVAGYVDLTSTPYGTVSSSAALANVPAGYYLIKDNGPVAAGDSYSTYIVRVVNDVTIDPKKDTVDFQKKIKDTNDTTGVTSDWQDSADYDIGDMVPFQLKAELPNNVSSYDTYYVQFKDQMEKGLTADLSTVKVYIDGKLVDAANYTVATASPVEGGSVTIDGKASAFTVTMEDVKALGATDNSVITVEYSAKLNEDAVIGSTGNVNEAKLVYSNNPNNSGKGSNDHGETPWDNVIVFTYKVVVNKVDGQQAPLAGAAFKLEKKLHDGSWTTVKEFEAGADTTFSFNGLDDGDYKLTETATPAGYNTIDPITFTVTAEHEIEWTTEARTNVLTSFSGDNASGSVTFTANKSEGSLSTTVVNKKGSELPSTGGMGTTVLYAIGGALVVAAGCGLVVKKRMAAK